MRSIVRLITSAASWDPLVGLPAESDPTVLTHFSPHNLPSVFPPNLSIYGKPFQVSQITTCTLSFGNCVQLIFSTQHLYSYI